MTDAPNRTKALATVLEPLVATHDGRGDVVRFKDSDSWEVNLRFKGPGVMHVDAVRGGFNAHENSPPSAREK
jgi:hypothetical protein